MVLKVHFYSYFKDLTGCAEISLDLPDGSTIESLLAAMSQRFPKLAPMQRAALVAVGVDYQPLDYVLTAGDEVSLFPPVQGG